MTPEAELIFAALNDARKSTEQQEYKTGVFLALAFESAGISDVEARVLSDYLRMNHISRKHLDRE